MNEEIEKSKKQVEELASKGRPQNIRKQLIAVICVLFLLLITAAWMLRQHNKGPLPKAVLKSIDFPVYYPSALPSRFVLEKNSVKSAGGVLFYSYHKNADQIYISEQAATTPPPDLKALENNLSFKKIEVESGSAVSGLNSTKPTALLLTNTTLITINATQNVPNDVLISLIKNMHSIEN